MRFLSVVILFLFVYVHGKHVWIVSISDFSHLQTAVLLAKRLEEHHEVKVLSNLQPAAFFSKWNLNITYKCIGDVFPPSHIGASSISLLSVYKGIHKNFVPTTLSMLKGLEQELKVQVKNHLKNPSKSNLDPRSDNM